MFFSVFAFAFAGRARAVRDAHGYRRYIGPVKLLFVEFKMLFIIFIHYIYIYIIFYYLLFIFLL